jgi:hypothetical protein
MQIHDVHKGWRLGISCNTWIPRDAALRRRRERELVNQECSQNDYMEWILSYSGGARKFEQIAIKYHAHRSLVKARTML